jgi:hypothetical protein
LQVILIPEDAILVFTLLSESLHPALKS